MQYLSSGFFIEISIHAPRTGSDRLSTIDKSPALVISIHAPRTGSDVLLLSHWTCCLRFQSTLPARGATRQLEPRIKEMQFQSTLPARGATKCVGEWKCAYNISIHAPRTGSDRGARSSLGDIGNFNPRSPHGERRKAPRRLAERRDFNPRSPHGERHGAPSHPAR